jgi:DNA primase
MASTNSSSLPALALLKRGVRVLGFVFNLDAQNYLRKYVIIVEGPIDAIHIGACAVLSNEVSQMQRNLIDGLGRLVIVVPDRDSSGIKLVKAALDYKWTVSYPDWDEGIKDVNDAVRRYGRVMTLYKIMRAVETSPLKIQLISKEWFKE